MLRFVRSAEQRLGQRDKRRTGIGKSHGRPKHQFIDKLPVVVDKTGGVILQGGQGKTHLPERVVGKFGILIAVLRGVGVGQRRKVRVRQGLNQAGQPWAMA